MSEDDILRAKIARIEQRIKDEEQRRAEEQDQTHFAPPSYGYGKQKHQWQPYPGTPYGAPRGRGRGRGGYQVAPHRNRTLVVNGPGTTTSSSTDTQQADSPPNNGWVTKRDRHMQLINNSVYEQKARERSEAMAETRKKKQHEREEREKAKIQLHLRSIVGESNITSRNDIPPPHVTIQGLRFLVADGGSKLVKTQDETNLGKATPKRVNLGGVMFYRSNHGNLYRAGLVSMKSQKRVKTVDQPCQQFSTTGTCQKGPMCRFQHDPEKVAICRDFLATGKCSAGDYCDLSHSPSAERVPACLHFLRGNCTNDNCRYAHVRTNPAASVCRRFANLGYCQKGVECSEKHVFECPDYANHGVCRKKKCRLPHVDRAGQLRKSAATTQSFDMDDGSSDVSSDDDFDYDSEDVDSEDFEEEEEKEGQMILNNRGTLDNHELSQQKDFVKF